MKLQEAIDKRHSVREFEKKKVPKRVLEKLILNATKAPSACNSQPWRFYVISNENKRNKIAEWTKEAYLEITKNSKKKKDKKIQEVADKFYENLGNAPSIILTYRLKEKNEEAYVYPSAIISIGAALENLTLTAVDKGLGICWVGTIKGFEGKIKKLLKIPEKYELVASLLVGYPKKGFKKLIRKKKKLNEVVKIIE